MSSVDSFPPNGFVTRRRELREISLFYDVYLPRRFTPLNSGAAGKNLVLEEFNFLPFYERRNDDGRMERFSSRLLE